MSLEFRLIQIEKRDPHTIAAMDHAIFEECESGRSPPTLVYHNWQPGVSIANGQALTDLNFATCREKGFDIVRLTTGGKAVVHFPDTEFSYSLFVPITGIDPRATYELYCGRITAALRELGISSAVVDNNDIFVGEKKNWGQCTARKKTLCHAARPSHLHKTKCRAHAFSYASFIISPWVRRKLINGPYRV